MRRHAANGGLLAVAALLVGLLPLGAAGRAQAQSEPEPDDQLEVPDTDARGGDASEAKHTYLVVMAADPVSTYDGGVTDLPATKPDVGDTLDVRSSQVQEYRTHLRRSHNGVMRRAQIPREQRLYSYTVALNGFAARMTGAQASDLRAQRGVQAVVQDQVHQIDTISTPDFLNLTGKRGAWAQGHVGDDIVIGVVDTGIWPESLSFCDRVDGDGVPPDDCRGGRDAYDPPDDWHGRCQTGEKFGKRACNDKLIGARYYNEGWGGDAGTERRFADEYVSPRDGDGHGTHTASTAAGNRKVPVVVDGERLGNASGMAPRARVAAYKACWGGDTGGCRTVDLVAAIDGAVADGVDVINYSISGTQTNYLDPVQVAFFNASSAGVFVAASAGNEGPAPGTVNHPSPWITTVAASTHDRSARAELVLGNGDRITGASVQRSGTDALPLVYAGDIPAEAVSAEDAALCAAGSLDPAQAAGKMVICDRGEVARADKSLAVREAGGSAMVMTNVGPNTINADLHFVPSIHVDHQARQQLVEYLETADAATGQLTPGAQVVDETAPQMAAFSSRGPLPSDIDLLKPDIAAPGVDIIAGVAPPSHHGRRFDSLSGTSMAAPHIAGLAAVVRSARPGWSPAAVKSALMSTASNVKNATPFDTGSGHVNVNRALDPGLVYDAGSSDYIGFLCGTGQYTNPAQCEGLGRKPANLNQPNVTIAGLAGTETVIRTVTNVGSAASTYEPTVKAPPGVDVEISHDALLLNPGQSATYRVTFTTRDNATLDEWTFGALTWSDGTHTVRSRLVVEPVALGFPQTQPGSGVSGSASVDVDFGYDGPYAARAHGMVPATRHDDVVVDDPTNDINQALQSGVGVTFHEVQIPDGSMYSQVSLFDGYTDGADDLDLYVFDSQGVFVAGSGSGTSAEAVRMPNPQPGTYTVVVHGWQTDGPNARYTLFNWSIPDDAQADDDSLVVEAAPHTAVSGESATVKYGWAGLQADQRYLGAITHHHDGRRLGITLLPVSTD